MRYQSLLYIKVQTLFLTFSHDVSYRAYQKSRISIHHFDFDFDWNLNCCCCCCCCCTGFQGTLISSIHRWYPCFKYHLMPFYIVSWYDMRLSPSHRVGHSFLSPGDDVQLYISTAIFLRTSKSLWIHRILSYPFSWPLNWPLTSTFYCKHNGIFWVTIWHICHNFDFSTIFISFTASSLSFDF